MCAGNASVLQANASRLTGAGRPLTRRAGYMVIMYEGRLVVGTTFQIKW